MADNDGDKLEWTELAAAILVGLATLAGAYSAYQAALWGGNTLAGYNMGVARLNDANTAEIKGIQTHMFDMLSWMEYKIQVRNAEREADVLDGTKLEINHPKLMAAQVKRQIMDERLRKAMAWSDFVNTKIEERYAKLPVGADGEVSEKDLAAFEKELTPLLGKLKEEATAAVYKAKSAAKTPSEDDDDEEGLDFTTPKDDAEYMTGLLKDAAKLKKEADEQFKNGSEANSTGDQFVMLTVLFTTTLFFGGLCPALRHQGLRLFFLIAGTGVLITAVALLLKLPKL